MTHKSQIFDLRQPGQSSRRLCEDWSEGDDIEDNVVATQGGQRWQPARFSLRMCICLRRTADEMPTTLKTCRGYRLSGVWP